MRPLLMVYIWNFILWCLFWWWCAWTRVGCFGSGHGVWSRAKRNAILLTRWQGLGGITWRYLCSRSAAGWCLVTASCFWWNEVVEYTLRTWNPWILKLRMTSNGRHVWRTYFDDAWLILNELRMQATMASKQLLRPQYEPTQLFWGRMMVSCQCKKVNTPVLHYLEFTYINPVNGSKTLKRYFDADMLWSRHFVFTSTFFLGGLINASDIVRWCRCVRGKLYYKCCSITCRVTLILIEWAAHCGEETGKVVSSEWIIHVWNVMILLYEGTDKNPNIYKT